MTRPRLQLEAWLSLFFVAACADGARPASTTANAAGGVSTVTPGTPNAAAQTPFSAVSVDTSALDVDHAPLKPTVLSRLWTADSSLFTSPTHVMVAGGSLVVFDLQSPVGPVQILDASTGSGRGLVGNKGAGPGEYSSPKRLISTAKPHSGVWVDAGAGRLIHFTIDSTHSAKFDREVNLEVQGALMERMAWLDDNTLVAGGWLEKGWFAKFDGNGKKLGELGVVPGEKTDSTLFRNHAYASHPVGHPSGSRFAYATRNSSAITLLRVNGDVIGRFESPFQFDVQFRTADPNGKPKFAFKESSRYGYVSVAATDSNVYALFSGRRQLRGRVAFAANFVHVFDWDGKLRRVLKVDGEAMGLAVDPVGSKLFVTVRGEAPTVIAYALPAENR